MKTIASLLTLLAATLLFGCGTASSQRNYSGLPAADMVVVVSCSNPSMEFTGTIVSDGHTESLSGTGSGTFHATGHELVCSFKKTDAEGRISISVSEAGKRLGSSSTPASFGGVRATVLRTPSAQHTSFTTF